MIAAPTYVVYGRADPTRTIMLRRAFVTAVRRRFNELTRVIRQAVAEDDVFALRPETPVQAYQMSSPGVGRFGFPRSEDKINAFLNWLTLQQERGILDIRSYERIGQSIEGHWTDKYVYDSYKRGVQRGRYELKKAGFTVPNIEESGGITNVMGTPFHADRLGVLYTRTFSELKGITKAMDQLISRTLTQGIADGDNPVLLARKLVSVINGAGADRLGMKDSLGRWIPGRRRAEIMARTEIIRAHHQATIQEYRNWGAEGVVVQAEWQTAGDERVCATCASMQGEVYKLDVIQNMIPIHAQCRCLALPYRPGRDEAQTWDEMPAVKSGEVPSLENIR